MALGQDSPQATGIASDSTAIMMKEKPVTDNPAQLADTGSLRKTNNNYWGTVGGSLSGKLGEINVDVNKNLFSAHYLEYKKWTEISFDYSYEKPEPVYKELGLLYGRILTDRKRRFYFSVSAGISRIVVKDWEVVLVEQRDSWLSGPYTYIEYGDYEHTIIGYPVKCKIMLCGKFLGVGLDLMANMNPDAYSTAAALHISFGKLR
jgi:hypothetical protein